MDQNVHTTQAPNVDQRKNINMNRSAILFNKIQPNNLPKYVMGSRKASSSNRSIDVSHQKSYGKSSSIGRNKTILQILEKSTKELASSIQEEDEEANFVNIKQEKRRFPREILNILFRQNVNGYNPYLVTLKKLDEIANIPHQMRENIKNICYIGIAKNQLRTGGMNKFSKYSRVGILIRPYMNYVMAVKMEEMRDLQPQTVYIKVNSSALSFNPYKIPPQLEEQISKRRYSQIIKGVNAIIEGEYQRHKMGNSTNLKNSMTYSEIIMYVVLFFMIMTMVVVRPESGSIFQYTYLAAIFGVICFGTLMAWKECNRNLGNASSSKNLVNKITLKIKHYLESVSNDCLVWKPGPDFYWLQVHNVRVKKRKYQQNNDDF